jgi:PBP1b-binding outer membrane lipoprotein LpoB
MKKLYSITLATGIALALSGCASDNANVSTTTKATLAPASSLNLKEVCSIQKNGIDKVLETANTYNAIAIKDGVDFRRLGMTTQQYIDDAKSAVKAGDKKVALRNKKGKKTKKFVTTNYAAWRGCVFAISALQLESDAKKTWRDAVPGDGFKW